MTTPEKVRESFEAWYKREHGFTDDHILFHTWDRNDKFINYEHRPIRDAWATWQAAIESQSSIIEGLRKDTERLEFIAHNRYQFAYDRDGDYCWLVKYGRDEDDPSEPIKLLWQQPNAYGSRNEAIDAAIATLPTPGESNNG